MKTKLQLDLEDYLLPLVKQIERREDIKLCVEDFNFLLSSISDFVQAAVDKFISGAAEHADDEGSGLGFAASVDHAAELQKEAIDFWFYMKGLQQKLKNRENNH